MTVHIVIVLNHTIRIYDPFMRVYFIEIHGDYSIDVDFEGDRPIEDVALEESAVTGA